MENTDFNFTTLDLKFNEGREGIAHLQLNRPDAYNSMNRAFWQEFPEAISAVQHAEDCRVLVISSEGKHFCAGMDLEVFQKPDPKMFSGDPARRGEFMRRLVLDLQAMFTQLEELRMPVLAAVQGGCIGGALDLVSACDSRYCTEDSFFTVKETAIGMTADLGTLQRLPQLIGSGLARELAYTARKMDAQEAQNCGLVNRVFADQPAMLAGVMEVAAQIAENSPVAVHGSKLMMNYARDHSLADSLNFMATWQAGMFQPGDIMESFAAKMQKRPTNFKPLHSLEKPFQ